MFIPWLIERIMDKVEATGKNRSGHAVAMYMNKRYGSQLMSQAVVQYMRGEHTPRGAQALELIEAAGLHPFNYLPFAECDSVFADKRSSLRQKYYWAFICGYWADSLKIDTPWLGDGGYLELVIGPDVGLIGDPILESEGLEVPDAVVKWMVKANKKMI